MERSGWGTTAGDDEDGERERFSISAPPFPLCDQARRRWLAETGAQPGSEEKVAMRHRRPFLFEVVGGNEKEKAARRRRRRVSVKLETKRGEEDDVERGGRKGDATKKTTKKNDAPQSLHPLCFLRITHRS